MHFLNEGEANVMGKIFVNHALAEDNGFGQLSLSRPDILDWFAVQRKAEKPDCGSSAPWSTKERRGWNYFIHHSRKFIKEKDLVETLQKVGARSRACKREVLELANNEAHSKQLEQASLALSKLGNIEEEYFTLYACVFVLKDTKTPLLLDVNQLGNIPSIRTVLDVKHVACAAYLSWLYESDERKKLARKFLCENLGRYIDEKIHNAQSVYSDAIAVSENGIKIVNADWLLLCTPDRSTCKVYSRLSDEFPAGRKLIRVPTMERIKNSISVSSSFVTNDSFTELVSDVVPLLQEDKEQLFFSITPSVGEIDHSCFASLYVGDFPEGGKEINLK